MLLFVPASLAVCVERLSTVVGVMDRLPACECPVRRAVQSTTKRRRTIELLQIRLGYLCWPKEEQLNGV